jgi:hypothetical protein
VSPVVETHQVFTQAGIEFNQAGERTVANLCIEPALKDLNRAFNDGFVFGRANLCRKDSNIIVFC